MSQEADPSNVDAMKDAILERLHIVSPIGGKIVGEILAAQQGDLDDYMIAVMQLRNAGLVRHSIGGLALVPETAQ